uniref:Uncharacterized protein n=1 Tax=Anguilla anguilla TaxID=7936 RepID=A0A0E9RUG3_ANGAN
MRELNPRMITSSRTSFSSLQ